MKLNRITIKQLCLLGRSRVHNYQDKLMIVDHIAQEYLFKEPCRIDAVTIIVCIRGRLDYVVNLEHNVVTQTSILVNMPENIIQLRSFENLEAYAILISTELLKALPYNIQMLANSYLPVSRHYHSPIPIEKIAPHIYYYKLIQHVLSNNIPETDEIIKGLLQAGIVSIICLMREHQLKIMDIDQQAPRGSRQLYERFMDALSTYHQQERTVKFYADKLCVTPKYLSMAVRDFSGKSPSDWICEYVIAEAKSLLHYSDMSVQEVSDRLHFPTQSAFGKFFKQKTGYSPLQYAKAAGILSERNE